MITRDSLKHFSALGGYFAYAALKRYARFLHSPDVVFYASLAYDANMLTLIESPLFTKLWPDYWSEEERAEFASFLAANPEVGDVIPDLEVAGKFAGRVMVLVSVAV